MRITVRAAPALTRPPGKILVLAAGEQLQQGPDGHVGLRRMTQPPVQMEGVARAPSVSLPAEVTGLFEVADDALGGAFGDVAGRGDVTDTRGGIVRDGQQHTRMVGEEVPSSGLPVHDKPCPFDAAVPGRPAGNSGNPLHPLSAGKQIAPALTDRDQYQRQPRFHWPAPGADDQRFGDTPAA